MSRLKTRFRRERFLRRVKGRPLRSITLLPSLVTLINGMCGFAALVFISQSHLADPERLQAIPLACKFIFIAMLADMLDGSLARFSQSTSSFGGQLDSLCDAISFGAAPAFLMITIVQKTLISAGFEHDHQIQRLVWLIALAYLCCTVIRLARFNVENEESGNKHHSFIGLPSPAAAGVVVSLVLLQQTKLPTWSWILYLLPLVTLAVAALMVSRIRYAHVVNTYLRGRKPFYYLLTGIAVLLAVVLYLEEALAACFCFFAFSSVVRAAVRKFWPHPTDIKQDEADADSSESVSLTD